MRANTLCFTLRTSTLSLALFVGCEHGDSGPNYILSCRNDCERVHQCLSSIAVEDCESSCESNFGDAGSLLRSDYLAGIDQCVNDLSCSALAVASLTDSCPRQARSRLGTSQSAVDLCDAVSSSIKDCIGISFGTAGCLDGVKIFSDQALYTAKMCAQASCDQKATCFSDALGIQLF